MLGDYLKTIDIGISWARAGLGFQNRLSCRYEMHGFSSQSGVLWLFIFFALFFCKTLRILDGSHKCEMQFKGVAVEVDQVYAARSLLRM